MRKKQMEKQNAKTLYNLHVQFYLSIFYWRINARDFSLRSGRNFCCLCFIRWSSRAFNDKWLRLECFFHNFEVLLWKPANLHCARRAKMSIAINPWSGILLDAQQNRWTICWLLIMEVCFLIFCIFIFFHPKSINQESFVMTSRNLFEFCKCYQGIRIKNEREIESRGWGHLEQMEN